MNINQHGQREMGLKRTCGNEQARRTCGNTNKPESTVVQNEDTFTIRDIDGDPSLNVSVKPGAFIDPPTLSISNGNKEVASFELSRMGPHEAGVLSQQDLTGQEAVDTISVQKLDNAGYMVEIGEFGPGKIHNGFVIRDSQFVARMRGFNPNL